MTSSAASSSPNGYANTNMFRQLIIANMSGGIASGIGVAIGVPFDIVKIRMQTFPILYKSAISTFVSIVKTEGIARGLFKGSLVPILSIVPANAMAFSGEDFARSIIRQNVY